MADYTEKQANKSAEEIYRKMQVRMEQHYRAGRMELGGRCENICEGVDDLMLAGEYAPIVEYERGIIDFDAFAAAVVAVRRDQDAQAGAGLANWTMTIC